MDGKVALITGGAQGLGRAFAESLLERRAKVCLADINVAVGIQTEAALRQKFQTDNVFFMKCDVTAETDIEDTLKTVVARFGHLDILVNNAGIANEGEWELMTEIDLKAVIRTTMLAFSYMGKATGRPDGVIINIASAAGVLPMPFGPIYSALKFGVVGYTRSIGVVGPKQFGVRVNCLAPSFTNTAVFEDSKSAREAQGVDNSVRMVSSVGIMQPREVADGFIKLVTTEKISAQTMLVTPNKTEILRFPKTVEEAFATFSKM